MNCKEWMKKVTGCLLQALHRSAYRRPWKTNLGGNVIYQRFERSESPIVFSSFFALQQTRRRNGVQPKSHLLLLPHILST